LSEILGLIGVAVGILTLPLTMPATSPNEFLFLRFCLLLSGGLILTSVILVEWHGFSLTAKAFTNALLAALVVAGITVAWDWLGKKQREVSGTTSPKVTVGDVSTTEPSPPKRIEPPDHPPGLSDLFKEDFPSLLRQDGETINVQNGSEYKFRSKIYFDFTSNTWFGGFYLPSSPASFDVAGDLADAQKKVFEDMMGVLHARMKAPGDSSPTDTMDLKFSGRIYIYHEDEFTLRQIADLTDLYKSRGISLQLRGRDYMISKWNEQRLKANPR
jgi:hypothetical protein